MEEKVIPKSKKWRTFENSDSILQGPTPPLFSKKKHEKAGQNGKENKGNHWQHRKISGIHKICSVLMSIVDRNKF